jgi:MYXO-CTERM domain-containing protein
MDPSTPHIDPLRKIFRPLVTHALDGRAPGHYRPGMSRIFILFITGALLATVAGRAAAQNCSGSGLAGTAELIVDEGNGHYRSLDALEQAYAVSAADCQCDAHDLALRIKLTQALSAGAASTAEVWVGTGCDNYTTRTLANQTVCEKVATLDVQQLTVASSAGPDGIIVPVPSRVLASPVVHQCPTTITANNIYVLAYNSPAINVAACTLEASQSGTAPPAALDVNATRAANGDVSLTWVLPDPSSVYQTAGYQVLCAGDDGAPLNVRAGAAYSTCVAGTLHRRGTASSAIGAFGDLDPAYVCSLPLSRYAGHTTVTGLDRTKKVHLVVVAFDSYGNATPSPVVVADVAAPRPTPTNGSACSFAAGASPASPWALGSLLALGALRLRRRRRR